MFALVNNGKRTQSRSNHLSTRTAMIATTKAVRDLNASDLMTTKVVRLPENMALRDAARLLLQNQISGAPVVDVNGKCVGVLSSADFLRLTEKRARANQSVGAPLPITCSFQAKHRTASGEEVIRCTLPPGVCPLQVPQRDPGGPTVHVCNQPHAVLADWQVVVVEKLPTEVVGRYMTPDPVTAGPTTNIRELARMMIEAHIHRVIIVDQEREPIGVVSSTDLLAVLANLGGDLSWQRGSDRA
jgi:CBS domain-containing protein